MPLEIGHGKNFRFQSTHGCLWGSLGALLLLVFGTSAQGQTSGAIIPRKLTLAEAEALLLERLGKEV